jgi:hypothetical protein
MEWGFEAKERSSALYCPCAPFPGGTQVVAWYAVSGSYNSLNSPSQGHGSLGRVTSSPVGVTHNPPPPPNSIIPNNDRTHNQHVVPSLPFPSWVNCFFLYISSERHPPSKHGQAGTAASTAGVGSYHVKSQGSTRVMRINRLVLIIRQDTGYSGTRGWGLGVFSQVGLEFVQKKAVWKAAESVPICGPNS